MASIISTAYVKLKRSWTFGNPSGKEFIARQVQITVPKADSVAYGDATNTIPASVLGLRTILRVSNMVTGAEKAVLATPDSTGVQVQTYDLLTVTDANRANVTAKVARIDANNDGIFNFVVEGY